MRRRPGRVIAECYHANVATLNIRNVPEEVVDALKARAAQKGVSLNSEVVQTLSLAASRRSLDETLANIARVQEQIPTPIDFELLLERMRTEREERDERVFRAVTRPPSKR
jgi:plasmid stability protein